MTEDEFNALAEPVEDTVPSEDTPEVDTEEVGEESTETVEESTEEATEPAQQEQPAQPKPQPTQPVQTQPRAMNDAQRKALSEEYQAALNKINPYNGQVIKSPEDFIAYKQQYNSEMQEHTKQQKASNIFEGIRNGTATQKDFDDYVKGLISDSPEIRASRQSTAKVQQMERQAKIDSGKAKMQADIDALNKEYPACDIKKVEDIKDEGMINYIRRGLSIQDAYYLTHRTEIAETQKASVRQAAVNQANGKSHLKTTTNNTKGEDSIPDEIINEYKHFFPDWTRKQIVENYKKRNGGKE